MVIKGSHFFAMKVILEPFEIDPTQAADLETVQWYDENKALTKSIFMLGANVIRQGVDDYVRRDVLGSQQDVSKEIEKIKKRHAEELSQEKAKHVRVLSETTSLYEQTIQQLKDSVQIEHIVETLKKRHQDDLARERETYTRLLSEASNTYHQNVKTLKECLNVDLVKDTLKTEFDHRLQLATVQAEREFNERLSRTKDEMHKDNRNAVVEVEKYRALYIDLQESHEKMIRNLTVDVQARDIADLREAVAEREKELNILKKATFAKGNKGEFVISHRLRELYPKYEFIDVSKEKHCGDIHMVPPTSNDLIMIESKYKEAISKQDIEKFYSDVEHIQQTNGRIICGIFVSILTRNIPNIGAFKIDIHNGIPVVFVGFSNESEFESWIGCHMDLAIELASYQQRSTVNAEHITDVIKKISPLADQIKAIKASVEKIRNVHMNTMTTSIIELENSIKALYQNMYDVISLRDAVASSEKQPSAQHPHPFTCCTCGASFASKKGLGAHLKAHKK